MYHGGGQTTSSQPGSRLLQLQKGMQQSPPQLDHKGARMEYDQDYQMLMRKWKTRLEVWNDGEKVASQWIQIFCVPTR